MLAGSLALSAVPPAESRAGTAGFIAAEDAVRLLRSLNERLLANASATLTLDEWCAEHGIAPAGSKIVAERVPGHDKAAGKDVRELLGVGPDEKIAYRRVRLVCGDIVLSEADNWYVPGLLTPEMNHTLETTNISFGRVVAPLGFTRETLDSEILWDGKGDVPAHVIRHSARLLFGDGRPFSALVENYTSAVLGVR